LSKEIKNRTKLQNSGMVDIIDFYYEIKAKNNTKGNKSQM